VSKNQVLVLTLVLGIVIGVSATGLVYASSESPQGNPLNQGYDSHMGTAMVDHHNSIAMPDDCDQDAVEECSEYITHHGSDSDDYSHFNHHNNIQP